MADHDQFLQMGTVGKAHGIKGEVAVNWHGENPLSSFSLLYLKNNNSLAMAPVRLLSSRPHKKQFIISLAGITDRNEAESLTGSTIYVPREVLPPPEENEAFLADLPGCLVLLKDGSAVGVLDHIEFPAGQEIWAVKTQDGREILFPAREQFIDAIDMEARRISIDPPPGLLDIYNA